MTWADIPHFPGYQVSSDGEVRSYRQSGTEPKLLKLHPNPRRGCLQVYLMRDGKKHARKVHALVALAFIGPRPEGMEVCHYDGNPLNNHLFNLDYDTHSANLHDQVRHGTHPEASRTHCDNGHEYTPDNIYWRKRGRGRVTRLCKTCHGIYQARSKAKRRALARGSSPSP